MLSCTSSSSLRNVLEVVSIPKACLVLERSLWTEHSPTPIYAAIMAVEIAPILIEYCTAAAAAMI